MNKIVAHLDLILPNERTMDQTTEIITAVTAPEIYSFAERSHISVLSSLDTGIWNWGQKAKFPFFLILHRQSFRIEKQDNQGNADVWELQH